MAVTTRERTADDFGLSRVGSPTPTAGAIPQADVSSCGTLTIAGDDGGNGGDGGNGDVIAGLSQRQLLIGLGAAGLTLGGASLVL